MSNHLMNSSEQNLFAYKQIEFTHWKDLRSYFLEDMDNSISLSSYTYRGHADASWKLQPTIERLRPGTILPFFEDWYINAEKTSIEQYKRAFHLFADSGTFNTEKDNVLDWLSVMQHHGAATRLLDMSVSPFIAAFFALSDVYNKSKEICIWAFPESVIDRKNVEILNINSDDKYQDVFDYYKTLNIGIDNCVEDPIIGYYYNDKPSLRPYNQKGGFLYSMANNRNFEDLLATYSNDSDITIKKLVLNISDRNEVICAFRDFSNMNISNSSLFTGLDGYSKDVLIQQYISNS